MGVGGIVFLVGVQSGGYDIHYSNRLVLYIIGKITIKSKQQHRGHARSFSVLTNLKLVFGHMTGF